MAGTTISGIYSAGITLGSSTLQNPATVTGTINATSGTALYGSNAAAWSVYNDGTISGPARGISLAAGGTIQNQATALISSGKIGVDIAGDAGTVINAGSIGGTALDGIRLADAGSVTNLAGGTISGGTYVAIYIRHGGTISNAKGGTIAGALQIYDALGTITNDGVIQDSTAGSYTVLLSA